MKGKLIFELLDYWHVGSGRGRGRTVDATVVRSADGLPYLPGRSVKGLLRHATMMAEELGHLAQGTTKQLFGTTTETADRYESKPGCLSVSSATLPTEWRNLARGPDGPGLVDGLFELISSAALDSEGQVVDSSLRTIEYAVPMTLEGAFELHVSDEIADPKELREALRIATALVRGVGASRTRGFGRACVRLAFEEDN